MTSTPAPSDSELPLLQRVCHNIAAKCRVRERRLLVAVSGGADSVALLRLLVAARSQFGFDLVVAHFDHRLRPRSQDDARFVRALAQGWGLDVHVGAWEDPRSSEAAARDARHEFLQRTALGFDCGVVVLGHQLDDQIETALMRLGRGSGPRGQGGMRWRRHARVDLVRPLLDCRRAELVAYLQSVGQPWCNDATNADLSKTRNRVRHLVLPALDAALGAEWRERWSASLEDQRALWTWLRRTSEIVLERAHRRVPEERAAGTEGIALPALRRLAEPLRRAVLQHWLDPEGRVGLRRTHLILASNLVRNGHNGQSLVLPGLIVLRVEAKSLVLERPPTSLGRTIERPTATRQMQTYRRQTQADLRPQTGRGQPALGIETSEPSAFTLRLSPIEPNAALHLLTESRGEPATGLDRHSAPAWFPHAAAAVICTDKTAPPFVLRHGQPGERVRLLGAPGSRRLRRILQDRKVPARLRPRWPVVADAHGIVWIPGVGTAERCRLDSSSAQSIRLSLESATPDTSRLAEVHDET